MNDFINRLLSLDAESLAHYAGVAAFFLSFFTALSSLVRRRTRLSVSDLRCYAHLNTDKHLSIVLRFIITNRSSSPISVTRIRMRSGFSKPLTAVLGRQIIVESHGSSPAISLSNTPCPIAIDQFASSECVALFTVKSSDKRAPKPRITSLHNSIIDHFDISESALRSHRRWPVSLSLNTSRRYLVLKPFCRAAAYSMKELLRELTSSSYISQ